MIAKGFNTTFLHKDLDGEKKGGIILNRVIVR